MIHLQEGETDVATGSVQLASAPPTIRICIDSTGQGWVPMYVPVPSGELAALRAQHSHGVIELVEEELPAEIEAEAAQEMAWFQAHIAELMERHPGEWVAISVEGLVAHGTDLNLVMQEAARSNIPSPFVSIVPSEPTTALYV